MNKTTVALKLAEEALDLAQALLEKSYHHATILNAYKETRKYREALAKPVKQEPVAGYAYATIKEYEELAGFSVPEAFRAGWNMARTTNSMLGIKAAPVQPVKQEPVISDVFFICDAYESGFGHGAKNDGLNDGSIFADKRQGEAYELGYAEGVKRSKREPVKQEPVCCETYGCTKPCPKYYTMPVKQEPVAFIENGIFKFNIPSVHSSVEKGLLMGKHELYAAPVSAEAIRAEALEEAAVACDKVSLRFFKDRCDPQQFVSDQCAAAIRSLK